MRSETLYLWGLEPDPVHLVNPVHVGWVDQRSSGQTCRGDRFAVEVCWISDGVAICRTYQVNAANEARAARIACQCARKALDKRATRIEAVDIEQMQSGDGHE
jgi:hypothetical protein